MAETYFPGTAPLIMLTGKLKSGKTSLAEALVTLMGIPRDSFARPLKEGLKMMGVTVDGPNKDRHALQFVGTDFFRQRDTNWWVNLMASNHADMRNVGLVVDDCRFPNEFEWGRDAGLLTVRIKIKPETQLLRGATQAGLDHISETALDSLPDSDFDLVLPEDTTVYFRCAALIAALENKYTVVGRC
jgi:hypothetical protein